MLEQKDFELLRGMIGEVMGEKLEPIKEDVQGLKTDVQGLKTDVQELKTDVQGLKTDVQDLKRTDKLILDEVVRVHESFQEQIDNLEKNMSELRQYYRVDRLENDNMALMLRLVNDLVKRVEELEKRIA